MNRRQWMPSSFVDSIRRDVRVALRGMRSAPGFAVSVIVTLAFGIGASATIFSVVDHVLLRPLAYPEADRLVTLYQLGKSGNARLVSYPTLQDWASAEVGLSGVAWIRGDGLTLDRPDGVQRVPAGFVSRGFFAILGQGPALGRTFAADEELPGGGDVAVLSHELWRTTFGGDPRIIGQVLRLDSASVTVIGVMPAGFGYPSWAALWRPLAQLSGRDPVIERRDFHADSRAIARLAPGVSATRARELLAVAQRRVGLAYPAEEAEWTDVEVIPLREEVVGEVAGALWALGGAVLLILVIACVNVANLAAVRGASRGREVAIRLALGAGRRQIVHQLAIESLTLGLIGGAAGVILAWRAVAWLRATAPFDLPRADEIAFDAGAVVLALGLTVLVALLFSVVPTLRAAMGGSGPGALLGSRVGSGGSRRETRGRAILTSAQFALALLLLVGAGLLAQSYRRLLSARLGFDPRGVLAMAVEPPRVQYGAPQQALALYGRLVERLRAEPGVEEAAIVNFLPTGRAGIPTRIEVPGRTALSEDLATYVTASERYLEALGIPLIRGRWFSAVEMRAPGDGIVISEAVARRYWPSENPVGKPLTIYRSSQSRPGFGTAVPSVVIGVVGDVRQYGVESDLDPAVYVPISAEPWTWVSLVVRERDGASVSADVLRRAVLEVEPRLLPLGAGTTVSFTRMEQSLSTSLAPRRYVLGLVGAFSVCAICLAAFGIYGVVGYVVSRRTHEFGVRIALGATRERILASVLTWGMALAVAGCAVGMLGALALVRLVDRLLYATSPTDATVLITTPLLLLAIGAVAVYVPARRAASVDPGRALRSE